MEHTTKIDKQGRVIIPAEFRKILSLDEGTIINIERIADSLVLKKQKAESEEKLQEWKNYLLNMNNAVNSESEKLSQNKWCSEEYVKKKLGI